MAERLAASAKVSNNEKAPTFDAIANTLREKLHVPKKQFKAYFVALLADKEFAKVLDTVAKVDKLFRPASATPRSDHSGPPGPSSATARPRVICYHCGAPGHIASRCYRKNSHPYQSSRPLMGQRK